MTNDEEIIARWEELFPHETENSNGRLLWLLEMELANKPHMRPEVTRLMVPLQYLELALWSGYIEATDTIRRRLREHLSPLIDQVEFPLLLNSRRYDDIQTLVNRIQLPTSEREDASSQDVRNPLRFATFMDIWHSHEEWPVQLHSLKAYWPGRTTPYVRQLLQVSPESNFYRGLQFANDYTRAYTLIQGAIDYGEFFEPLDDSYRWSFAQPLKGWLPDLVGYEETTDGQWLKAGGDIARETLWPRIDDYENEDGEDGHGTRESFLRAWRVLQEVAYLLIEGHNDHNDHVPAAREN